MVRLAACSTSSSLEVLVTYIQQSISLYVTIILGTNQNNYLFVLFRYLLKNANKLHIFTL